MTSDEGPRPDSMDRETIRMALRGEIDMRLYVPEVMRLCAWLGIDEPAWLDEPELADRVALNRASWPARPRLTPTD